MKIDAKGISPEVVAVIAAALQMMGSSFQAVKITRTSDAWTNAGRQNA
ncbi:MAG: hypothetical protein H7X79_12695 [Sporomusaceae bacterium]|nr:hypothetical protein [Sporomusaceae bacterium]